MCHLPRHWQVQCSSFVAYQLSLSCRAWHFLLNAINWIYFLFMKTKYILYNKRWLMQKTTKRRNKVRQNSWNRHYILQATEQIQECEEADSVAVKHVPNNPEKIWGWKQTAILSNSFMCIVSNMLLQTQSRQQASKCKPRCKNGISCEMMLSLLL